MEITYSNNSAIAITEVGEDDSEAVLCKTDLTPCCAGSSGVSGQGDWIYPNGTKAGNRKSDYDIFRTRGDMVVRLHRMDDIITPTGQYCCEVGTMASPNTRSTICITLTESLFPGPETTVLV